MSDNGSNPYQKMDGLMLDRVLDAVALLEATDGDSIDLAAKMIGDSYNTKQEYLQLLVVMAGMGQAAIAAVAAALGTTSTVVLAGIRERTITSWSAE